MGNRGLLHSPQRKIVRTWRLKAWIICVLAFKDRQREVMTPGRYTELFFLDEATALAAGHRPCGECRYPDYKRFKSLWLEANGALVDSPNPLIQQIDQVIHRERIDMHGNKVLFQEDLANLPNGVFVLLDEDKDYHLILNDFFYRWSPAGYESVKKRFKGAVHVITPRSIVKTIRQGYQPQIHSSISHL